MSLAVVRRVLSGGEQPSPVRRRVREQLLDDLPLAVRGQPGTSTSDGAAGGDRKRFILDDLPISVRRRLAAEREVHHIILGSNHDTVPTVYLTGKSRDKEVDLNSLSASEPAKVREAMKREWAVYTEFRAVSPLTRTELQRVMKRDPQPRIIDTQWVVTENSPISRRSWWSGASGGENRAPYGQPGRLAPHSDDVSPRRESARMGYSILDTKSAFLQSESFDRLLLLRMPYRHPPPGCVGQMMVARGSIYGTGDAGRSFYIHSKRILENSGANELSVERAVYAFSLNGALKALIHTHIDDFFVAHHMSKECFAFIHHVPAAMHMKDHTAPIVKYRGILERKKDGIAFRSPRPWTRCRSSRPRVKQTVLLCRRSTSTAFSCGWPRRAGRTLLPAAQRPRSAPP